MAQKNYNSIFILTLILIMSISLMGCQPQKINEDGQTVDIPSEDSIEGYPLTLIDSMGREITLESEPKRVISVGPNITETIYAIGAEDKLIARTDYCDYPEDVLNKDSIGSLREPNIEKILELNPDLIIASTHFDPEVLKKLEGLNLKVAVLYGEESFEGAYNTIEKTGIFLNKEVNAQKIIEDMKSKVNDVIEAVKDQPKPEIYYVVSYGEGGDYTATGETFISQIIEMAGGKNAADDAQGWKYNIEKLVEKDPDILICPKYFDSKQGIIQANGYKELTAVKEGRLFEIDNNMLDRQGPRIADGLEELAKILHPDQFE